MNLAPQNSASISFMNWLSQNYGTGSLLADAVIVLAVFSLLCILLAVLVAGSRPKGPRSRQGSLGIPESFPVAGRIEKLERSVNELRTDTVRSLQIIQAQLERIESKLGAGAPTIGDKPTAPHTEAVFVEEKEVESELQVEEEAGSAAEVPTKPLMPTPPSQVPPVPLKERLAKTRAGFFERLKQVFGGGVKLDEDKIEELRALLIQSDIGVKIVDGLISDLKSELKSGIELQEEQVVALLKMKVRSMLELGAPSDPAIRPVKQGNGPLVVLVVGVNGVGKTTTCAKLASSWLNSGAKVLLVAADTFRAAAVDQLREWGNRLGVPVVCGVDGAKPATVVYDGMQRALSDDFDVVLIDTAGRLHTKSSLMQELEGVRNAITRHQAGAPHETLLVIDGTTGQNALNQAREFNEATKLSGLVITKLDGTPKGGAVIAVKDELGVPVRYIGVGESPEDLRVFSAHEFVEAIFQKD